MKKVLAILLALSVLALSACAARQANSDTQKDSKHSGNGAAAGFCADRRNTAARAGSKAHRTAAGKP